MASSSTLRTNPHRAVSGLWKGSVLLEGTAQPIRCAMTVDADQHPTVCGVTLAADGVGAPGIVVGTYEPEKEHKLTLRAHGNVFAGKLVQSDEGTAFAGTLTSRGVSGAFTLTHQSEDPPGVHAGHWMGTSTPDPSLAAFCIPVNPISWCLYVSTADETVAGGGYFNDAGDVPGCPVLLFTLQGSCNDGKVTLRKVYEASAETEGYSIDYTGDLIEEDGSIGLKGTWRNEKGGSFGSFECWKKKL
ncbi:hypothetical protein DIPPA_34956 [Diplonema papillatum]|nr:hypothetical protein DIPPA_34956 [Diplonema papillatum]